MDELQIESLILRDRKKAKALAIAISNAAATGDMETLMQSLAADGIKLTEQEIVGLLAFVAKLARDHELKRQEAAAYDELEKINAEISNSPLHLWPPLIEQRNAAQARLNLSIEATRFLANINYRIPQLFENYIPRVVLAAKQVGDKSQEAAASAASV